MIICRCSFLDVVSAPNWSEVWDEYCTWASEELPRAEVQMDIYMALEKTGNMLTFAAWEGDNLVGYINVLIARIPHYPKLIATTESLFVSAKKRSGGAGVKLIRMAREAARSAGAAAILISAPMKGPLGKVLEGMKFKESNRVFSVGLE